LKPLAIISVGLQKEKRAVSEDNSCAMMGVRFLWITINGWYNLKCHLVASRWHFKLFHEEDAQSNNPQMNGTWVRRK